ncbi:MAG: hypothetical protein IKB99_10650 [Lentisphaeria bacterium]|nr:hypothetical protein [Lentisphaeria bacterium]
MRFVNIVPVFPDNVEHMIAEAKRMYEECGIDEPTLCMTLHPQGGPQGEKVEIHRKAMHEMMEGLKGTPIKVGVLFQTVLGHRVDCECTENWQKAVNINNSPNGRMCLLDENYRKYLYEMVRTIAGEHPHSLLIDDDFRQINGKGIECFCPNHMARFNEGLENPLTADELRQALKEGSPDNWVVKRFEAIRKQVMLECARIIRSAIDSVDPSIRCGCCTPGYEFLIEKDIALALAGNTKPFIRFCNANYTEGDAKGFPYNAYKAAALRQMMPGIEEFIDEADTCPHNRYSKSAKSMHAKLVLAGLNKEAGAKLWLTNLGVPDPWTARKYDAIMAKHKKFYPALRKIMEKAEPMGFTVPLPSLEGMWKLWHPLNPMEIYYSNDWQFRLLGHYGIPACYADLAFDGVRLVNKDILKYFNDAEIKKILSGKVLLDRAAAVELVKKGYGEYIGLETERRIFWANTEWWCDGLKGIPFGATGEETDVLKPASDKTKVLSTIYRLRYHKDQNPQAVASGCTVFDNAFGGRVAVSTQTIADATRPYPRSRMQLIRLLEELTQSEIPLYVECDQNVFTRQFKLEDGSTLLAVFNLNFDELENIELKGSLKYSKIEYLTPAGEWALAPRRENIVDMELRTYDCVLLRLS